MKKTKRITFVYLTLLFSSALHADVASFFYKDGCNKASTCGIGCGTFSIGGDWLDWKVEQQKMEVGAFVTATSDDAGDTTIDSTILKPKPQYKSGYRFFADYVTADKNWKVEAAYTHVPSSASFSHVESPADISFDFVSLFNANFPLLSAVAGTSFSSVNSSWNVDIDYFDLDLARKFSLCDCLDITPHIGIRGLRIDQKLRINGADDIVFTSVMKAKLEGIGIEGGLWGNWNVGCGFSVLGHIGGSLVYARLHNKGSVVGLVGGTTTTIGFSSHDHLSLPSVDSFIGLGYSTSYCNKQIDVHVGWEHHTILNTNQFSFSGGGDMTMQGLTLGGSVTF